MLDLLDIFFIIGLGAWSYFENAKMNNRMNNIEEALLDLTKTLKGSPTYEGRRYLV